MNKKILIINILSILLILPIANAIPNLNNYNIKIGQVYDVVNVFTGDLEIGNPIIFLPGRGLDLSLVLNYNSHTKNDAGWVGSGWNLDLGYIYRNKYVTPGDSGYTLVLGDDAHTLIQDGKNEYKTKRYNYQKIYNENNNWYVITSDGTKYTFSYTSSYTSGKDKGYYRWDLTSIEDIWGNKIIYEYTTDTLRFDKINIEIPYLSLIKDTLGRTVTFETSSRTDLVDDKRLAAKKLDSIVVRYPDGSVMQRYNLGYDYSFQNRLTLRSITQIGEKGGALPPVKFDYSKFGLKNLTTSSGGSKIYEYEQKSNGYRIKKLMEYDGIGGSSIYIYNYFNEIYFSDEDFTGHKRVDVKYPSGYGTVSRYFYVDNNMEGLLGETQEINEEGSAVKKFKHTWDVVEIAKGVFDSRFSSSLTISGNKQQKVEYKSYDNYGHPLEVYYHGYLDVSGDEMAIISSYIYNTDDWLLDMKTENIIKDSQNKVVSKVSYGYGDKGEILRITEWLDSGTDPVTKYGYDNYGNMISVVRPNGNSIYIEYSSDYNFAYPTKESNKLYTESYTSYYLDGLIKTETDVNNKAAMYTYDEFRRVEKSVQPGDTLSSPTITYEYDRINVPNKIASVSKITDSMKYAVISFYDGFDRLIQTQTLDGKGKAIVRDTKYNSFGEVENISEPYEIKYTGNYYSGEGGSYTTYIYTEDPLARNKKIINPDGSFKEMNYNDNIVVLKNENGIYSRVIYDAYGNKIKAEIGSSGGVTYDIIGNSEYDVVGNLLKSTDPNGNSVKYTYDSLGRMIKEDSFRKGVVQNGYDSVGNLIQKTDASGKTIEYEYDKLSRLIKIDYPERSLLRDDDVVFTYDSYNIGWREKIHPPAELNNPVGKLTKMKDSYGEVYYFYDELGRLIKEVRYDNKGQTYNLTYAYNKMHNIVSVTYPSGIIFNYKYDNLNRLVSKRGNNGFSQEFSYYPSSSMSSAAIEEQGDIVTMSYTYNKMNNRIETKTEKGDSSETIKNSYDKIGNIVDVSYYNSVGSNASAHYVYDNLNRVVMIQDAGYFGENTTYTYDKIASILTKNDKSYVYDSSKNLLSDGIYNYTYDKNNMLSKSKDNWSANYTYNYDNNLIQVDFSDNTPSIYYIYDGKGRMVKKVDSSGEHYYYYDPRGGLLEDDFGVPTQIIGIVDSDGDGIADSEDNCPDVTNPDQRNTDAEMASVSGVIGQVVKASITGNVVAETDIVALWNFDEGSGTTAQDSAGNNDGILMNNPTWSSDCKFGSCLSFDGIDDYIYVRTKPDLSLTTDATIEVWVKPIGPGTRQSGATYVNDAYILGKGGWDTDPYRLFILDSTKQFAFMFRNSVSDKGFQVISSSTFNYGDWYHITMTVTGNQLNLYVNGVLEDRVNTKNQAFVVNTQSFIIGQSDGHHFKGKIDEVAIYNRALTPEEVLENYNKLKPSLLLYDNFDETTSATTITTTFVEGKYGQGILIDNADKADYNFNPNIQKGTIEYWIKPLWDVNTDKADRKILLIGDLTNGLIITGKSSMGKDASTYLEIFVNGEAKIIPQAIGANGLNWQQNRWYHVAWVWDADKGDMKVYINGELANSYRYKPFKVNINSNKLQLGYAWGNAINSVIDELKIYNILRTADEIKQDMLTSAEESVPETKLPTEMVGDELGDACDEDDDNDGTLDENDLCERTYPSENIVESIGCNYEQVLSYDENSDFVKELNELEPGIYGRAKALSKGAEGKGLTAEKTTGKSVFENILGFVVRLFVRG